MNVARKLAESGSAVRWRRGAVVTRVLYRRAFGALGEGSNIMKPRAMRGIGGIFLGERFVAYPGVWLQCELGRGPLRIGDDASLVYDVQIHAYDPVTIGDRLRMASHSMINSGAHLSRFDTRGAGPIVIGDNVFIGQGASVLGGVIIGHNVTVGAGSVVTRDVPDNSIVGGVPARVIGSQPS